MDVSFPDLAEIQSVDVCKDAIRRVKLMKKALARNNNIQENGENIPREITGMDKMTDMDGVVFFDSLPLIDIALLPEEDETTWLKHAPSVKGRSVAELEMDKSYMDSFLLNVQFVLINEVKSSLFEQRFGNLKKNAVPVLGKTKAWDRDWRTHNVLSPSSSSGSPESVSNSPRCPINASSPVTYRVPDRDLDTEYIESSSALNSEYYIATPPKNIDTRTYTRPKKIRTSLDPHLQISSGTHTLTLSRGAKGMRPSLFNSNGSGNLNETFIHEDANQSESRDLTVCLDRSSRRVSRNLSYVVRRSSDSPSHDHPEDLPGGSGDDLNTTFTRNAEECVSSPTDSNSSLHNISMEELHSMARRQEQSLNNVTSGRTIARKDTHVIMDFPIIGVPHPRPPVRTSSTDTYYVGQSNPDSPGSSGLSSPVDSQSYNDISAGGPLGRSMPNLAMSKRSNLLRPGMSVAPPMNTLTYKNHYISDSKLSHPVESATKLSLLKTHGSGPIIKSNMHDNSNKEMRMSSNTNGNPSGISRRGSGDSGIHPSKMVPPRSGLVPPKFTSSSQIRPPGPAARSASHGSMLPAPGFSARLQSRIPAPGASRGRPARPATGSGAQGSASARPRDWRDGCY